jgi:hypothetical protein
MQPILTALWRLRPEDCEFKGQSGLLSKTLNTFTPFPAKGKITLSVNSEALTHFDRGMFLAC